MLILKTFYVDNLSFKLTISYVDISLTISYADNSLDRESL